MARDDRPRLGPGLHAQRAAGGLGGRGEPLPARRTAAAASVVAATRPPSPARLSSSRSLTMRASRSTSPSAASRSSACCGVVGSLRASSSRSRSPASGVRSWWEASATNCRWTASSVCSRAVIALNDCASARCSVLPSICARTLRSPPGDAPRGVVQAQDRARDAPGDHDARDEPEREHEQPDQAEREPRAQDGPVDGGDALRHAHGAGGTGRAREDRHRGREDVLAERQRAAAALRDVAAQGRRDLRAAGVRRADGRGARRVRQDAPRRIRR